MPKDLNFFKDLLSAKIFIDLHQEALDDFCELNHDVFIAMVGVLLENWSKEHGMSKNDVAKEIYQFLKHMEELEND